LLRRARRAKGLTKPIADQRMKAAERCAQSLSEIGCEVVTRKDPPAGRHASNLRDVTAAAVAAAAPAAAPMTVDFVFFPRIWPRIAPAIAPPTTFLRSAFLSRGTSRRPSGDNTATVPSMARGSSFMKLDRTRNEI